MRPRMGMSIVKLRDAGMREMRGEVVTRAISNGEIGLLGSCGNSEMRKSRGGRRDGRLNRMDEGSAMGILRRAKASTPSLFDPVPWFGLRANERRSSRSVIDGKEVPFPGLGSPDAGELLGTTPMRWYEEGKV